MRYPVFWLVFAGVGIGFLGGATTGASGQQTHRLTDTDSSVVRPAQLNFPPVANLTDQPNELDRFQQPLKATAESHWESWPSPRRLIQQIESVQEVPQVTRWGAQTLRLLEQMSAEQTDRAELRLVLRSLEMQRKELAVIVSNVAASGSYSVDAKRQASEIFRLNYRLEHRLAVWNVVVELPTDAKTSATHHHFSSAAFKRLSFPELSSQWVSYLLLDEYRAAFETMNPDSSEQKKVARRILARIHSPVLKTDQATYIQQVIDPKVIELLKSHASQSTDGVTLLTHLERHEYRPSSFTGFHLNNEYQNLLWSEEPRAQAVAEQLEVHFRNSNLRMTVSEKLMNRLIPTMPMSVEPVHDQVQGAQITGQSQIENNVRVQLVPDASAMSLRLESEGYVRSKTIARKGPYRIQNRGEARILVSKLLAFSRNGIDSSHLPQSYSAADQSVVGVESKFDGIPVLGWMARGLAKRKLRESDSETDQLFRRKVVRSAESRVQQEVETKLGELRRKAYSGLFQPLMELELEPYPYQMSTTKNQVVMRYRLAGRDQMAAHTSRPSDTGHSLVSLQVHQSAINNSIARLGLNGNEFTSQELARHLREVVGAEPTSEFNETNQQTALFTFAQFDPIRVDFADERVNLVLNLKSLKVGEKGKTWKRLTLTASYRIQADGMKLQLVQDDDGTRIKGKRLRLGDKAGISTVMKVLFKKQYSVDALPAQLTSRLGTDTMEVSQLLVSDGWLGLSIDDRRVVR